MGDISIINKNKKLDKSEYNYVEISDINDGSIIKSELIQTVDLPANAKNIGEYGNILISCVRPKKSKMMLITKDINNIEKYVFSSALANIKLNDVKISYYIYGMLYILVENFEKDLCNGSSYPRFKPTELNNLQIPIPKAPAKITEWVEKISKPYDEKNTKQAKIQELEKLVQSTIKNITENEECDEVELGSVCKFKTGIKFTMSNHYINNGIHGYIRINNLQKNNDNMLYLDTIGFNKCKNCLVKKGDLLLSDVSETTLVKIVPEEWNNYVHYGSVIKCNNILINNYYLYYYFLSNYFNIQRHNKERGSIQKHLTLEILNKLKIKIPKNKKVIEDLEPTFKEIETLQNDVKKAEELYKQLIKELSQEAIPNQPIINDTELIENIETEIQKEIVEIPITTKSKKIIIKSPKSKKTSTTLNDILTTNDEE